MLTLACLGCGSDTAPGMDDVDGAGGSNAGAGTAGLAAGDTSGAGGGAAGGGAAGNGGTSTMTGAAGAMAPPGDRDGTSFAMVAPGFAEAYCGVLSRCVPEAISVLIFGGGDCQASVQASFEDAELSAIQTSIDSGRTLFDPSRVDACFDQLASLDCEMQSAQLLRQGACGEILGGTVAEGGDCGNGSECSGDAYCDLTAGCPGVCTKQREPGAACFGDDECIEPASCSSETGTCVMAGAANAACGGGVAAGCRLGSMCSGDDPDTMTAGTCKPNEQVFTGADSAACDFATNQLCAEGLACVVTVTDTGSGLEASYACAKTAASGAACHFGFPSQCPDGEYCNGIDPMAGDVDGTCVPLPGAGATCAQQSDLPCAADLVCDADNACHPLGRIGDPCVTGFGCASNRCFRGECALPQKCEVR